MERNNLINKSITFVVILLFVGLAFAPSINANVSKTSVEDELVEFTTEVCGLNGGKHTVQLSKAEAKEVEQLFDDIKLRLDGVETREETVEIFKEAVVELDNYGLLGGLSVKQAQRLVTGRYRHPFNYRVFNRIHKRIIMMLDEYENLNCIIAGVTQNAHAVGPPALLPIKFNNKIDFGIIFSMPGHPKQYFPAEGWVFTGGFNGIITWNGSFYGQYGAVNSPFPNRWMYRGTIGFTGIFLFSLFRCRFIGFAQRVKLGPDRPDL